MIIKRQFKMYTISIHNTQHLCVFEKVAKYSVRYNGVLHFDPASLMPFNNTWSQEGHLVPSMTKRFLY